MFSTKTRDSSRFFFFFFLKEVKDFNFVGRRMKNQKRIIFLLQEISQLLTVSGNLFMNIECSEKIHGKEKNMALFTHCEA